MSESYFQTYPFFKYVTQKTNLNAKSAIKTGHSSKGASTGVTNEV